LNVARFVYGGDGKSTRWQAQMNQIDVDAAKALITQLGGELNGTSIYLDEATQTVTHAHLQTLLPLLSSLPNLSIGIADSQITDNTLAFLSDFTNINDLCLTGTSITDAGIASLATLTGLTGLVLNETYVSDIGVHALRPLVQLKRLGLGPNVTDDCVETIRSFKNLRHLTLEPRDRCQISDSTLSALKSEMKILIAIGGADPNTPTEYV
jgi:hypothetical protein